MQTEDSYNPPKPKAFIDSSFNPSDRNESEACIISEISFTKPKSQTNQNEVSLTLTSHREPTGSVIESSDLAIRKPVPRLGERLSTVVLTSESVISRNRLQECSIHFEKLCEHKVILSHSRKFEEKIKVEDFTGLYVPVFSTRPTIAFCSRCGRDVKTKVKRIEQKFFDMKFSDFFCCWVSEHASMQEIVHFCSRCRAQIVKITV